MIPTPLINPPLERGLAAWRQRGTAPLEIWYGTPYVDVAGGLAVGINTFRMSPFVLSRGARADRIAFEVTVVGAAGSVARVGIYRGTSRSNLYPAALVVDGGEFDTSVVGGIGVKAATISATLPAGFYWLAYLCGVAAPTIRIQTGSEGCPTLGFPASLGSVAFRYLEVAQVYGALPATAPAGGVLSGTTSAGPHIVVRFDA